jgi:hypothetical protein
MIVACVDGDNSVIVMLIKLIIKVIASGVMTIFVVFVAMMVIVGLVAIRGVVVSAMMGCC